MAEKQLKSIKFAGLGDTYVLPEIDDSLSTSGMAADAKVTGDALAEKANYSDVNSALAKKANTSDLAGKVNTSDVINIAHGGTGATDGSGALYNLINRQDFPTSSTTLGYGEYRLVGGSYSWYGLPDGAWGSLVRFPGWDGYNFELCMITANATEGLYYRDFMHNTWIRIPTIYNSLGGKISTWLPSNYANPTADVNGFFAYSTNTGLVPSYGFPNGFSEYGTIFGVTGTSYPIIMYVDVFGNFAAYNTNQGRWNIPSGSGSDSGSSVTYGLVKSGNTITLTGSDGSSSSVTDDAGGGMSREFNSGAINTTSYSYAGNQSKIYTVTTYHSESGTRHTFVFDYMAVAANGNKLRLSNYTAYGNISVLMGIQGSSVGFETTNCTLTNVCGYY